MYNLYLIKISIKLCKPQWLFLLYLFVLTYDTTTVIYYGGCVQNIFISNIIDGITCYLLLFMFTEILISLR